MALPHEDDDATNEWAYRSSSSYRYTRYRRDVLAGIPLGRAGGVEEHVAHGKPGITRLRRGGVASGFIQVKDEERLESQRPAGGRAVSVMICPGSS